MKKKNIFSITTILIITILFSFNASYSDNLGDINAVFFPARMIKNVNSLNRSELKELSKIEKITLFIKRLDVNSFISPIIFIDSPVKINSMKKLIEKSFNIKLTMGKNKKILFWKFYSMIKISKNKFLLGNKLVLKTLFKSKKIKNFKIKWSKKLKKDTYMAISLKYKDFFKKKSRVKNNLVNFIKDAKLFWLSLNDTGFHMEIPLKYTKIDNKKLQNFIKELKDKFKKNVKENYNFSEKNGNIIKEIYFLLKNIKGNIKGKIVNIEIPFENNLDSFMASIIKNYKDRSPFNLSNKQRNYLMKKVCDSHKKLIEIAIKLWKIDHKNSNKIPTIKELINYGYLVKTPICPEGGRYKIETYSDGFLVKCSLHDE